MTPVRIGIRVTGHLIDFCSVDALELPDGASISDAIFLLGIPVEQVGLVSIDGQAVSKAKRDDLIQNEQSEIEIIIEYLPQQKTQEETEKIINEIITTNNLESIKDMGKLMSIIKNDYAGEVDMGLVGKIAKSKLVN